MASLIGVGGTGPFQSLLCHVENNDRSFDMGAWTSVHDLRVRRFHVRALLSCGIISKLSTLNLLRSLHDGGDIARLIALVMLSSVT